MGSMVSDLKEWDFSLDSMLIRVNVNSCMWSMATLLGGMVEISRSHFTINSDGLGKAA